MKRVSQTTHRNLKYINWSRDSSVGRAGDWKSRHLFDHIFCQDDPQLRILKWKWNHSLTNNFEIKLYPKLDYRYKSIIVN